MLKLLKARKLAKGVMVGGSLKSAIGKVCSLYDTLGKVVTTWLNSVYCLPGNGVSSNMALRFSPAHPNGETKDFNCNLLPLPAACCITLPFPSAAQAAWIAVSR
ncbi:MAG: hypothetical protein A2004_13790 [Spirochaetes bacterium GWC1_61_12]|nr:MAG: hypothetical protein A2004_13790 [Spirochaetes bacterium GWC1_61_12]